MTQPDVVGKDVISFLLLHLSCLSPQGILRHRMLSKKMQLSFQNVQLISASIQ